MTYQFVRKVSQGGFSEIFEVRDLESALPEALILKRLSPEMSTRPDVRRAFTKEGEILSNLRHDNIVNFRRCYYDDLGRICLLMEKIEGEDLALWARRNRQDSWQVMETFRQILEAVDFLHHRATPLLHLDLKPDNILVSSTTASARPVLIDFGIARSVGGQGLKAYTPPYAAPEQQNGGRLGCFTDVYALGQILHELLESLESWAEPSLRKTLQQVTAKARASSRRKRYPDAGSMLTAFRGARTTHFSPPPKQWWAMAAAAAALAVLAIPALYLAFDDSPGSKPQAGSAQSGTGNTPGKLATATPDGGLCAVGQWPNDDPASVSHLMDLCIKKALASDDLGYMEVQYSALSQFLENNPQQELLYKVHGFKESIDARDR